MNIKQRRTIRKYTQQPVSDELLNRLIGEASRTQTMGNLQLYSVVVTRKAEMKEKLAPAHFLQPMVTQAPVVLTVCADFRRTTDWCTLRDATPGFDNPLSFEVFETNADFVSKTEEGLRTLCQFRHELQGYSRLLDAPIVRKESLLQSFVCLFHRIVGPWERRRLTGPHPSLLIFKAYKLGYYLTYLKTNNKPS